MFLLAKSFCLGVAVMASSVLMQELYIGRTIPIMYKIYVIKGPP